jgi:hypothetical protein
MMIAPIFPIDLRARFYIDWRARFGPSRYPAVRLILIALLVLILLPAFLMSITYIRGFNDDNAYHIPIAVEIARQHNPFYVDRSAAFTSFWFPAAAETLVAAFLFVTRDINASNLSGFLVFCLFLVVNDRFARLWSNDLNVRLLCVLLAATIPVLLGQTMAFYVDIHINFLVYLSLYCFCASLVKKDVQYVYWGLCSAFMTTGVKYHGLAFLVVLLPVSLYCIRRFQVWRPKGWVLAALIVCILFPAGYYLRNWLLKGNPIYPLPLPFWAQSLTAVIGNPYQALTFAANTPHSRSPYPAFPWHFIEYTYAPDMTEDAFGFGFTISLVLFVYCLTKIRRLREEVRHPLRLLATASLFIFLILPFGYNTPRYVLFLPAVTALAPAIYSSIRGKAGLPGKLYGLIIVWGVLYTAINLYSGNQRMQTMAIIIENMASRKPIRIANFDYVEQGDLEIGYMNGRFGFIALLYDRKMTNHLVQLNFINNRFDLGQRFRYPEAFVANARSKHLDYIHIFDPSTPGADYLMAAFPGRVFSSKSPP